MRTATTPRKSTSTARSQCVPIYLAVVTGRRGTSCPFAHVERKQVEQFCQGFNGMTGPDNSAVVKVSRYRLPAVKGGAA